MRRLWMSSTSRNVKGQGADVEIQLFWLWLLLYVLLVCFHTFDQLSFTPL